jgi:hypothetical protein
MLCYFYRSKPTAKENAMYLNSAQMRFNAMIQNHYANKTTQKTQGDAAKGNAMYVNSAQMKMNAIIRNNYANSTTQKTQGDAQDVTDRVTLSDAARQMAPAEQTIPQDNADGYPLKMYSVPYWRAKYGFDISGGSRIGAPGDWFSKTYPQAASASTSEGVEYGNLVQGHYIAVLRANGIHSLEEHYRATILDQELSESLHQQMNERVRNDPRLLELLERIGKQDALS